MSGYIFFLFAWSGWIYCTFLLNKNNRYRFPLAFILLILIICSNGSIQTDRFHVSVNAIILTVISYLFFANRSLFSLVHIGIRIFIITVAFASFQIMALIDPVWLIFDKTWMQGGLFALLSILLFSRLADRIFSTVIGFVQGECIYASLLQKWSITYEIGSLTFFDSLALTILFTTIWSGLEHLQRTFHQQQHMKGREKSLL
ncbi:hypothetical protein [Fervidibacillus albus]|uniref:Integral membrane protein n=1 Tax=Fervidibacillus albus TaxID=2980026 RepID=A0A9E8RYE4_9BACI|nr:hypothetical protein [Fervidibacillus albus]WAA10547.1 hypothetical protein OE104_04290 [Fervidibacillus albus]